MDRLYTPKTCYTCLFEKEDLLSMHCIKCMGFNLWEPKNIEAKSDAGKPKLSLVPRQIIYDIAKIREYGNAKYPDGGPDNWKKVEIERYRDAAFRHFLAYLDDPKGVDKESGLPHLAHLACNIAFLCELEKGETNDNAAS